jgi:hypothetical protein
MVGRASIELACLCLKGRILARLNYRPEIAELLCRLPPVAVRAAHLALCDLGEDDLHWPEFIDGHHRDGAELVAGDVVEVKDDRVRLAAVDAWMRTKIFEQPLATFLTLAFRARLNAQPNARVRPIAFGLNLWLARPAVHLPSRSLGTIDGEVIK